MSQSHIRYFLIVFLLHFNRKAESTFLSTEKDNVYNKNNTQGDKKLFVSKNPKKNKFDTSIELQSKSNEANNKFQQIRTQKKTLNRKNVTDGRVRLVVAQNDCVPEDYLNDYRDNPFDSLEQTPWRTTSYIENLRSRDFSQMNQREVERLIEKQQNQEIGVSLDIENLEYELEELSETIEKYLGRFFKFFQGFLPGFCIMNLFLIFSGPDKQTTLESYVWSALRVFQIFQVVALISTIGGFNSYIEINKLLNMDYKEKKS